MMRERESRGERGRESERVRGIEGERKRETEGQGDRWSGRLIATPTLLTPADPPPPPFLFGDGLLPPPVSLYL